MVNKSGLGYTSQPRGFGKKWTTHHTSIAYKEAKAKRLDSESKRLTLQIADKNRIT